MNRSTEPGKLSTSCKQLFTVSALALSVLTAAADARVKVVSPETRTFVEALSVQGTVRSKSCAAVSARVAGTIDELCVEEGAPVALGTPLFRIDRANLENAVRSNENDVRIAEAALFQSKASLAKSQSDEARMTKLVLTGAVSTTDTEKAILSARTSEAQLMGAEALLAKAQTGLAVAKKNLADSEVCAPFAGTIVKKLKDVGDYASPGMPVFMLEDVERLEIRYMLDASKFDEVAVGETMIDGRPVSWKAPTVDPATRSFEVRVDVSGADGFCPGMLVDSKIVFSSIESLAVPASAVNPNADGEYMLFTVEDGRIVRHAVGSPKFSGGWCSIAGSDVQPGAKVVSEGMLLVHEGDEAVAVED